jgi:hypothetical protein
MCAANIDHRLVPESVTSSRPFSVRCANWATKISSVTESAAFGTGHRQKRLRLFRLDEGRLNLRKLKPLSADRVVRREFRALVLARLAAIADGVARKNDSALRGSFPSDLRKRNKRKAEWLRRIASKLERDVDRNSELRPIGPALIVDLLRSYAELFDFRAEHTTQFVSPPSCSLPSNKVRVRTRTHQSRAVIDLVELVKTFTGEPHWAELTVLLRLATADHGYTPHRLISLCSLHWRKRRQTKRSAFWIANARQI